MSWKTWAPFQSKETRDVLSHMTKEEEKKIRHFSGTTGLIVAIFFAIPLSFGISWAFESKSTIIMVGIILWVLIGIPILLSRRRKVKELLCSTKWAKEKGYTPDKI